MPRWVVALLCTRGLWLAAPAAATASVNLLPNPGFESGTVTGWTSVAATGAVTGSAYEGSYAAQVTRKTGVTYGLRTTGYSVASTTSGHAYSGSGAARTPGATETLCQRIREYTTAGTLAGSRLEVRGSGRCLEGPSPADVHRGRHREPAALRRLREGGDGWRQLLDGRRGAVRGSVLFAAGDIACEIDDPSYNGGQGTTSACRQAATAS
jgi:hypothetical protein